MKLWSLEWDKLTFCTGTWNLLILVVSSYSARVWRVFVFLEPSLLLLLSPRDRVPLKAYRVTGISFRKTESPNLWTSVNPSARWNGSSFIGRKIKGVAFEAGKSLSPEDRIQAFINSSAKCRPNLLATGVPGPSPRSPQLPDGWICTFNQLTVGTVQPDGSSCSGYNST